MFKKYCPESTWTGIMKYISIKKKKLSMISLMYTFLLFEKFEIILLLKRFILRQGF